MCIRDRCEVKLKWWENIPILSFLLLRGRCRYCQAKIPFNYFLTELVAGLLFIWVFWFNINTAIGNLNLIKIFFELFIVSFLLFIFLHDVLYQEILPLAVWLGLGVILIYQCFAKANLLNILWGMLLGFGFFALQYFVSKGKWIGGGDVRLGLFIGALLGWEKTIVALFTAYWLGALVGLYLMFFKKKKMNSEISFGTFLVVGTFFAMYYGESIIRWYVNFVN